MTDHTVATKTTPIPASHITLNEALLRLAIIHGLEVEFRYAKGSGTVIEHRRLQPARIAGIGQDRRFVGYDPDREAPRGFRLDRIKGRVVIV
jgi:predicted DNA-binding transcriptional regulator YafY